MKDEPTLKENANPYQVLPSLILYFYERSKQVCMILYLSHVSNACDNMTITKQAICHIMCIKDNLLEIVSFDNDIYKEILKLTDCIDNISNSLLSAKYKNIAYHLKEAKELKDNLINKMFAMDII